MPYLSIRDTPFCTGLYMLPSDLGVVPAPATRPRQGVFLDYLLVRREAEVASSRPLHQVISATPDETQQIPVVP